jgi:hypothetical protein
LLDVRGRNRHTARMFSSSTAPRGLSAFATIRFAPVLEMARSFKVSDSRKARASRGEGRAERLVARLLRDDAAYARKVAAVRRHQKRLQGRLSAAGWLLYLQLEEAEVGRWSHALDRVAQWALGKRPNARKR